MLFVSTTQEGQPPQVLGAIGCMRLRPVTDYVWLRPFEEHYQVEVVLRDYSRWSEPATGLLARLLARRPADGPRQPALRHFQCQMLVGRDVEHARVVEQLAVFVVGETLATELRDELSSRRRTTKRRAEYASLDDVLVHAARVSVWGSDEEPPIPTPLTEVPIRKVRGMDVVLESDIPAHPRKHFAHRCEGSTVPFAGAVFAHSWLNFIGA